MHTLSPPNLAGRLLLTFLICLMTACTNTLKYDEVNKPAVVTTDFGASDLQTMVSKMTDNMLTHPAVLSYILAKRPLLAVDALINQTGRPIQTELASATQVEKLLASDSFRISGPEVVKANRGRVGLIATDAIEDNAKALALARALNADLILFGDVSEVIRAKPATKEVYYRIQMRLLDKKNGGIVWQEETEFLKSQKKTIFGV